MRPFIKKLENNLLALFFTPSKYQKLEDALEILGGEANISEFKISCLFAETKGKLKELKQARIEFSYDGSISLDELEKGVETLLLAKVEINKINEKYD